MKRMRAELEQLKKDKVTLVCDDKYTVIQYVHLCVHRYMLLLLLYMS